MSIDADMPCMYHQLHIDNACQFRQIVRLANCLMIGIVQIKGVIVGQLEQLVNFGNRRQFRQALGRANHRSRHG